MRAALKAGLAYFAIVFSVGALLGTLRVLVLAPRSGELLAVAIELPVMLAVSWVACRRLVARFSVPGRPAPRAAMGGLAFGLLMGAEIGVSVLGFGRTVAEHLEAYRSAAALMGLAGQIAFALFPLAQSWVRAGRAGRA